MKLATLDNGSRDGALVVVSRDLSCSIPAGAIAPSLQFALDNWKDCEQALQRLSQRLNEQPGLGETFNPARCMAPLPRAYQWADGSAYVNHVALVRQARGAEMPQSFWTEPLIYQGGSDAFVGPRQPISIADAAWGIDLEAEIAVITDDVAMGSTPQQAGTAIRLLMLVNDVSLRNLIPGELAKGFGFFQSKPATAFSPVAVTPDELGAAWQHHKLHRPLLSWINDAPLGRPDAGVDMTFDFAQLVAHAARTRHLRAGSIIGSGTVSNRDADGGPGRPISEGGLGYSCLAELRTVEKIRSGEIRSSFLQFGDQVRIDMHDDQGRSLFGAIEQAVTQYQPDQAHGPDAP